MCSLLLVVMALKMHLCSDSISIYFLHYDLASDLHHKILYSLKMSLMRTSNLTNGHCIDIIFINEF